MLEKLRYLFFLILLLNVITVKAEDDLCSGFVTRNGNQLYLNGEPYRAIRVNIPNLHNSFLGTWRHDQQIYGTSAAAKKQ